MSGWNPRDKTIPKENIDIVNEFWFESMNQTFQRNNILHRLSTEIIFLKKRREELEKQVEFLYGLLDEANKSYSKILETDYAMNDERKMFTDYEHIIREITDRRSEIFKQIKT